MKQAIARRELKQPLHEYLVRSVNVGKAASTLNDMLHDIEVSPQRERTAIEIWRKLVPSLQAVAIEIQDARPVNVHDLNAMLLHSGLDALPTHEKNDNTSEKALEPGAPAKSGA